MTTSKAEIAAKGLELLKANPNELHYAVGQEIQKALPDANLNARQSSIGRMKVR